jgi:hypothetical protein
MKSWYSVIQQIVSPDSSLDLVLLPARQSPRPALCAAGVCPFHRTAVAAYPELFPVAAQPIVRSAFVSCDEFLPWIGFRAAHAKPWRRICKPPFFVAVPRRARAPLHCRVSFTDDFEKSLHERTITFRRLNFRLSLVLPP